MHARIGAPCRASGRTYHRVRDLLHNQVAASRLPSPVAAATAGFIVGGGLMSPIGSRITATTIRATFGNLATLVALDVLRRGLENGGTSRGGAQSSRPD